MTTQELPIYDFENDKKISETRKTACKTDYLDMQLHHLDKIYTSAFVYHKETGVPIAKKPRSIHELIFNLLKVSQALTVEINNLKDQIKLLQDNQVSK